ncbi:MAG: HAMP domain-containing protein [Cellvibrionaceae bacterium]|nr:HAMP domain-containing protein [Cellvibrionaceae bacterium]
MKSSLLAPDTIDKATAQQAAKPLAQRLSGRLLLLLLLSLLSIAVISGMLVEKMAASVGEHIETKNQFDLANIALNDIAAFKDLRLAFDKAFSQMLDDNQGMMYSGDFSRVTQVFASMNALRDVLKKMYQHTAQLQLHLQAIAAVERQGGHAQSVDSIARQINHLNKHLYKFGWQFDQLVTNSASTLDKVRVGQYQQGVDHYLSTGHLHRDALLATAEELTRLINALEAAVDANSVSAITVSSEQFVRQAAASLSHFVMGLLLAFVVIAGIGMASLFLLMTKPIAALAATMQLIAKGDVDPNITFSGRKDDIGDMQNALLAMVNNYVHLEQCYRQAKSESQKLKLALMSGETMGLNDSHQPESMAVDHFQLLPRQSQLGVKQ